MPRKDISIQIISQEVWDSSARTVRVRITQDQAIDLLNQIESFALTGVLPRYNQTIKRELRK